HDRPHRHSRCGARSAACGRYPHARLSTPAVHGQAAPVSLLGGGTQRLPPLVTVTPRAGPAKKEASTMRPKSTTDFAQSAPLALQRINDAGDPSIILILTDINMP